MAINARRTYPPADLARTYSFLQGLIVAGFALIALSVYLVDATARTDVRTTPLDRLPEYPSAALVLEYESVLSGARTAVREYSIEGGPKQVAAQVTSFYREWLLAHGWLEEEARTSLPTFTKGDDQVISGRVGSHRMHAPSESVVKRQGNLPGISSFLFTIEALVK